jgi:N-hydroxyarylamine O-acetyltransferase
MMNELFRKRIGISENEPILFERLDSILEKMAKTIPFENLYIVAKNGYEFSEESLIDKILIKNEGGLCYDLNAILYMFLLENGFHVRLVRGIIFNSAIQKWSPTGRTHVAILLKHLGQTFLIDSGFGGNLPLKPVPLTGEIITSENGEFQVVMVDDPNGDYQLKMKLKHKDADWKIAYIFDTKRPIQQLSEINEIQEVIRKHEHSPFNKGPLITQLTDNGSITLTDTSFTQWVDGECLKEQIDPNRFQEFAKKHFKKRNF